MAIPQSPFPFRFTASIKIDPDRAALKNVVLYYRDYAVEGNLKLGNKTYRIFLDDVKASGDFRTAGEVRLLIDVNGNGRFDQRGESYALNTPFNIGGTTYEVSDVSASGERLVVGKSAKRVAEILPPPDLSPGKKALTFTAKTTGGETIRFPESYKGKLVLLDFWATWCGPCKIEIPWFIDFEQKYKDRGFAVLGVAMDEEGWTVVKPYLAESKINYRVVMGNDSIASLYGGVDSLPTTFILDKDGKIASTHVGLVSKSDYENEIVHLLDGSQRSDSRRAVVASARPTN